MIRPCYLVVDREYAGSISTRKLVIETAKFNVITAYSSQEGIDTLRKYPRLDGVVLDATMPDMQADDLIRGLREVVPGLKVVAVSTPGRDGCTAADLYVETYNPANLLETLQTLHPEFSEKTEALRERMALDASDEPESEAGK